MSAQADPLAAVRQARAGHEAASEALYALELQRLAAARMPADQLETARRALAEAKEGVRRAIDGYLGGRPPHQLIESMEDRFPILLLPLRVETRWRLAEDLEPGAAPELWVRIFPDDIAKVTHEKTLTEAEVEHGQGYWTELHKASRPEVAWAGLSERFGANRAAWVALRTRPENWEAAAGSAAVDLVFPTPELTKPDPWTIAPHTRVLPDRFVLMAWREDELVLEEVGRPVDDVVFLGPSPLEEHEGAPTIGQSAADGKLELGEPIAWLRDFEVAVDSGLGFRVQLGDADVERGFDRLLALGIKSTADPEDTREMVEELIDGHHYSLPGFSLIPQGSPTNNTEGNETPYTRPGRGAAESGPPLFTPVAERATASDGQRLADYLGISYAPLQHADGAELSDHAEAVAMNRALFAGTLGYYLDQMLDGVLDEDGFDAVRAHFTELVSGRGALPAIRVGPQPYGILPTSAFHRWESLGDRHGRSIAAISGGFEAELHRVLARLDEAWEGLESGLATVGADGSGAANLLKVLGLQPTSAALYQRVGYSWDYLRNLDEFAYGGRDFADSLKRALDEGRAEELLADIGYSATDAEGRAKPTPLLLQLIWRHYHTKLDPKQLIDGLPLSETRTIKPYDAARPDNYMDWLRGAAGDVEALESEDFGGDPTPTSLLYMMLRYSLLMEAKRGLFRFLTARGVESESLVHSAKFLNIGPAPTPSPWQAFRAPANLVVPNESSTLPLFELIYSPQFSEAEGRYAQQQLEALKTLGGLPTARLERALSEHVDTLTYRLDAWQSSLFCRRLEMLRELAQEPEGRRTGLYLGAFGFLENLRPAIGRRTRVPEDRLPEALREAKGGLYVENRSGGYVHAPSLNHATAAALLRNGYLTHASEDAPEALAVNLSSDRVRRARGLLEGIRNGQSLEALLGVQFERGLHDWTTREEGPVILDQLKAAFRTAFPIRRTRVPQAAEAADGAGEVSEDTSVVNGLDLALDKRPFPYGIAELSGLDTAQQGAIEHEKDAIADTLDSLRDVLTAEAAYQLALGNFDRAAAIVRAAGDGTVPPDVEVLGTPRGTDISFTQRLIVSLSSTVATNPWPAVPMTPRARLEPALNHWLGGLLGDPATIRCTVAALDEHDEVLVKGGGPVQGTMSLADLGLQPLDFVYIVRRQLEESGMAELEARVRNHFAHERELPDGTVVRVAFADGGVGAGARPFAEALALGDRARRLLGAARPLGARHFQSASKDEPAPTANPDRIDLAELRERVGKWLEKVRELFPGLETARNAAAATPNAASAEALRAALGRIAEAGFAYAVPRSAFGAGAAEIEALLAQAKSVLERGKAAGEKTDALLAVADAAGGSTEGKVSALVEAVRAWAGEDFLLLPRFALGNPGEVAEADGARDQLLAHATGAGRPLPVREWLLGAACVRPLVHNFELLRTMAEATGEKALPLAPLQLPHRPRDSWLATEYPPGMEVLHDTISIAQHLPQGFDASAPQIGLLIDEWVEIVPSRAEVTGISFNFDAPDSAPPQALLLAVAPRLTGHWEWEDLVETVLDTFRRARLRAVEPDAIGDLPAIGTLLPAVLAEFSTGAGSISLDYLFSFEVVRASVAALSTEGPRAGG
jgi:hypothetical protein